MSLWFESVILSRVVDRSSLDATGGARFVVHGSVMRHITRPATIAIGSI